MMIAAESVPLIPMVRTRVDGVKDLNRLGWSALC